MSPAGGSEGSILSGLLLLCLHIEPYRCTCGRRAMGQLFPSQRILLWVSQVCCPKPRHMPTPPAPLKAQPSTRMPAPAQWQGWACAGITNCKPWGYFWRGMWSGHRDQLLLPVSMAPGASTQAFQSRTGGRFGSASLHHLHFLPSGSHCRAVTEHMK